MQLSALTLFLKARSLNKECAFSDKNLACANVEAITGGRLEEFIKQSQFSHPIYERILRAIAARMKDSDQLGSLLRLEKDLEFLIGEERKKVEQNKQLQFPFPGLPRDQFETKEGVEEFFEILFEQLLRHLDFFVQSSRATGVDPGHFGVEAAKGLRYLRLVSRQYDVVATNPPYLSRRNMSPVIAKHLDESYTNTKGDLYAAFIARCLELAGSVGKVAMVTQQSFMFIKSYEKMRDDLREVASIDTMMHLGPKAFPNITGEKVNTTAFVLCKETGSEKRQVQQGIYFRLVWEKDAEAKRLAFEEVLAAFKSKHMHPLVFACQQEDFETIPGKPWAYWLPENIMSLFKNRRVILDIAQGAVGQNTGDNKRFVRFFWEVPISSICRIVEKVEDTQNMEYVWYPYMKGGTPIKWWGNQSHIINWYHDAIEVKALAVIRNEGKHWSRYIQNLNYAFKAGVTWSDVSSKGFSCRSTPGGFLHDVSGMGCYPKDVSNQKYLMGILNSSVSNFLLSTLNPTIHYQKGDIERLPIPDEISDSLNYLTEEAIRLAKQDSADSEITYDFIQPPISVMQIDKRHARLRGIEEEIDKEVTRLYGLTEAHRFALKAELKVLWAQRTSIEIMKDHLTLMKRTTLLKAHGLNPPWLGPGSATPLVPFWPL